MARPAQPASRKAGTESPRLSELTHLLVKLPWSVDGAEVERGDDGAR